MPRTTIATRTFLASGIGVRSGSRTASIKASSFTARSIHINYTETREKPCSMLRGFRAGDRRAFFVSSDERARMSEIASKLCPLPRWWLTLSGHDSKACAIISIGAQAKLHQNFGLASRRAESSREVKDHFGSNSA
jgi:hypothetical protein